MAAGVAAGVASGAAVGVAIGAAVGLDADMNGAALCCRISVPVDHALEHRIGACILEFFERRCGPAGNAETREARRWVRPRVVATHRYHLTLEDLQTVRRQIR